MALIELSVKGPVARVTLNRPEQRNALSIPMLVDLTRALGDLAVEAGIRAVVLDAAGPDFCAGADLAEVERARSEGGVLDFDGPFHDALQAIATHPAPVVAAIRGSALGGGCQVVLACDLAVAAEDAVLGIPSARLGIVIPLESIERLVLAVGPKRASEILMAGRVLRGTEAREWGIVNRTTSSDVLGAAVESLVLEIAEMAPLSVRASKRGIGLAQERRSVARPAGRRSTDFDMMVAAAFASEDLAEGIQAFRDRRPPEFRGA